MSNHVINIIYWHDLNITHAVTQKEFLQQRKDRRDIMPQQQK